MSSVEERVQTWLNGPFDEKTKEEIRSLKKNSPQELKDAFYQDLAFGTGGMRGIMGVGTTRLNIYTIQMATQGLANVINHYREEEKPKVFIGYDVRHHSREFAEEAARVLAGNDIEPLLSKEICPTPLTSFACRHFGCAAAIMITASHNPPQYNGYKVYWHGGCQVVPPHDKEIMEEAKKIQSPNQVKRKDHFKEIGEELDKAYLKELQKLQLLPKLSSTPLKIVYTNLHGTGIRLMQKGLKCWGYNDVILVEKQKTPDPDFTNAGSPNPEEDKALTLGLAQLKSEGADLLIATDPDADRIALATPDGRLTGNEAACVMLDHICQTLHQLGQFPENGACIKSIVTTELFKKVGENHGAKCIDVLTGFKYIGELIGIWESAFDGYQYLFGAEESYGCLLGTFVRDKDAISAGCLAAETAASAKKQNLSLVSWLHNLYKKHGVHRTKLKNLRFDPGLEGKNQMDALMKRLRETPPKSIHAHKVVRIDDYLKGKDGLPPSNVLIFWLDNGTKIIVRPSGTEPKVKIYLEVIKKPTKGDILEQIRIADNELEELMQALTPVFS